MDTNERRTTTKTDPKGVRSLAPPCHPLPIRIPAKVAHLSPEERKARGKAARNEVPLESHADFAPQARPDPIDFLEEQAKTRVPGARAHPATAAWASRRSRSTGVRH